MRATLAPAVPRSMPRVRDSGMFEPLDESAAGRDDPEGWESRTQAAGIASRSPRSMMARARAARRHDLP
jgi:hypothetical protein